MTLCEGTLLRGMFVHSAGDYAQILADLTGMNQAQFVAKMNNDAKLLGLRYTHYVDETGISPGDVSKALDQATLAVDLMTSHPIIRNIVALSSVVLPVAGVVGSFTPFIGLYGVVGVKSGFTNPAGGCDVMAINLRLRTKVITTYAVVLGEHGNDPLGLAGQAALNLSRSLQPSIGFVLTPTGEQLAWIGSPSDIITPPTTTTTTTTTTTITAPTTTTTS
jgi:D-alanyl-D-alanine carboxypeptidase (penicillin-binding protein 5/6)